MPEKEIIPVAADDNQELVDIKETLAQLSADVVALQGGGGTIIESGEQESSGLTVTTTEQDIGSSSVTTGELKANDIILVTAMVDWNISSASGAISTVFLNVAGSNVDSMAYKAEGSSINIQGGGALVERHTVASDGTVTLKLRASKNTNNGTSSVSGKIMYFVYRP